MTTKGKVNIEDYCKDDMPVQVCCQWMSPKHWEPKPMEEIWWKF